MKNLRDKVVVITGAASGIGRALALDLAGKGALLALSDVDETGLAGTVELARAAGAREVRGDRLDVADRAAFEAYAEAVVAHFGRVNVVVNNAGVALAGDLLDLEYDDIDWIIGINFWGVVHGTKAFLPHLIASGEGHVVNISSLFGLISMPGQSMYNAAKYAVRGMTEALREEMLVAGHPVGVTSVHPGGIKTAIARNARVSAREDKTKTAELFDKKLARMTPEKAAQIIVRGITRNQARVLVGIDAHALHHLAKLTGSRYQDIIAKSAKKVLRRTRRSSEPAGPAARVGRVSLPDPRPVRVEMSKWGERPHWSFDGLLLGEDEWGDWIGVPAGVLHERPGARFHSAVDTVTLAPREGWYAATFHAPGIWASVYVDLATPPVWDGDVLRSVDLDFDVVRTSEGRVYVDDEDEFEGTGSRSATPDEEQAAAPRVVRTRAPARSWPARRRATGTPSGGWTTSRPPPAPAAGTGPARSRRSLRPRGRPRRACAGVDELLLAVAPGRPGAGRPGGPRRAAPRA